MRRMAVATKPRGQRFQRFFGFFGDIFAELKKVSWPSRRVTINLTVIVIIVSVAVGLVLGLIDLGFYRLMDAVFFR